MQWLLFLCLHSGLGRSAKSGLLALRMIVSSLLDGSALAAVTDTPGVNDLDSSAYRVNMC